MELTLNWLTFVPILLLLVLCISLLSQRAKNFPPGPWRFPIVGHLPLLGREPFRAAIKWLPQYGPIIGLKFGSIPCIFITGHKLIHEALAESAFSGRPKLKMNFDRGGGQIRGVISTSGRAWQEQRRFTHRTLRDFGFGRKAMESIIQTEIQELIESLKPSVGEPISTAHVFSISVLNTLWTIVVGERVGLHDPELNRISQVFRQSLEDVNVFSMMSVFIPWIIKHAPNCISHAKEFERTYKPINEMLQPIIDEHFESHIPGQPRDFIDAYIDEMKATKDPSSSFYITERRSLLITVNDLFIAALETTSTTLSWLALLFSAYPDVQDKVFAEVKRVIGTSRPPSLSDRDQMPYTEAAICEVMRSRPLLPNGVYHSTVEDVQFHGYDVPKDTMIFYNVYEAHYNTEFWGDPENFRPERFLSKDGSAVERRDAFMPFGTGKRICLGERLARDTLFLFTASFYQVFRVALDPNGPPVDVGYHLRGTIPLPKPHKLVLALREG